MGGLHSLSFGKSHRYAVFCEEFVNAGFVQANEVACAARAYNGLAVVGWVGVGTKVLQENKLFKTKESLGLTVPGLCKGAGLQFLCVQPFCSDEYHPSSGLSQEWYILD